jgi:hypothetical protein
MSVIEFICATFMVAATVALMCLDAILIHNIVKAAVEYFRLLQTAIETKPETDLQTTQKEEETNAAHPATSAH